MNGNSINIFLYFFGFLIFLTSCNTVKYLDDGQTYLKTNTIKFAKGKKIKNKSALTYELSTLYKQKPNENFFWASRRYFYFSSQDTIERFKIGKVIKQFEGRRLAEDPVYYENEKQEKTVEAMTYYLQHKGYFGAKVEAYSEHNKRETKTDVTYVVNLGGQYKIDTLTFKSQDRAIQKILDEISDQSVLKKGKPIDVDLYNQEVSRLNVHMLNNGYAFFQPQYVSGLEGLDSSDFKVRLEMKVFPPKGDTVHQVYRIGDVTVFPNYGQTFLLDQAPDTVINNIRFVTNGIPFRIKPRTLINSIQLRSGDLFKKENETNTNLQLSSLGVFSFVTIKSEVDSLDKGVLNFKILLTQNKKNEFGADFDINQASRRGEVVNRNLIGFFVSPSMKNRNMFKGAELMVTSVDAGVELAIDNKILNTVDLKIQSDLYFPRFVDYLGFWKNLRKLRLVEEDYYNALKGRGNTKYSASYNFYNLLDYYQYNLFNFSMGYDVQRTSRRRFIVNNLGIDFLSPDPEPLFQDILDQNPFLERSFSKQLLTGFLLRDFTYINSSPLKRNGKTWYIQGSVEFSGLEVLGLNKLYNTISGKSDVWKAWDVDFSQYFRFDLDLRQYWRKRQSRTLVARVNGGLIIPLGNSEEAPYVKQFFVGGPQSIRGMYARGIGPGAYNDPSTADLSQRSFFYQTGDIKLEWNLEYRYNLANTSFFGLNGAVFMDGGNVWTLDEDERPGAKYKIQNTFKEMAVSVGTGLRFDFTYFIFFLDVGTLIKNNYPDPNRNNTYWSDFSQFKLRNRIAYHFGIGYPF